MPRASRDVLADLLSKFQTLPIFLLPANQWYLEMGVGVELNDLARRVCYRDVRVDDLFADLTDIAIKAARFEREYNTTYGTAYVEAANLRGVIERTLNGKRGER